MSIFQSALAAGIDEFIGFKRSSGYLYGESSVCCLKRFDRYCLEQEALSLTREVAEGWAMGVVATASRSNSLSSLSIVRELGRFLRAGGDSDAYILPGRFRRRSRTVLPYLLSEAEIAAFFTASNKLVGLYGRERRVILPAVFYAMHSLGLRTCEVRGLKREDVDLMRATIDVLDSKGPRDRRLPLSEELAGCLADYDAQADLLFPGREAFFPSSRGGLIAKGFISRGFNAIWGLAGLPRPAEGPTPRPYSFRHHFAFANIARWARQGLDIDTMMPCLSRFMGHSSLQSTYYYIHASSDVIADVVGMGRSLESLLPEVVGYGV
jgi:integrase